MTTPSKAARRAPHLIQQYVTQGDRGLREWHLLLRRVTFGAAIILMGASVVSLHYACALIGLPDQPWAPIAWIVPLAMETGMAAVASTATTIRKEPKPGREGQPGAYYWSLWCIFSFVMMLAQAANIGHAAVVVSERITELPPFIPDQVVYIFACAFAALFPLGGTLLVHVSGFLRAHGTGARWIEDDTEVVFVEATAGAPAHPVRAPRPTVQPARTATPPPAARASEPARAPERVVSAPAQVSAPAPAEPAAPVMRQSTSLRGLDPERQRARELYEAALGASPTVKPDAKRIKLDGGIDKNDATVRRWVQEWWAEDQVRLAAGQAPEAPAPAEPAPAASPEEPTAEAEPEAAQAETEAKNIDLDAITDDELDALTRPDEHTSAA